MINKIPNENDFYKFILKNKININLLNNLFLMNDLINFHLFKKSKKKLLIN